MKLIFGQMKQGLLADSLLYGLEKMVIVNRNFVIIIGLFLQQYLLYCLIVV